MKPIFRALPLLLLAACATYGQEPVKLSDTPQEAVYVFSPSVPDDVLTPEEHAGLSQMLAELPPTRAKAATVEAQDAWMLESVKMQVVRSMLLNAGFDDEHITEVLRKGADPMRLHI